MTQIITLAGLDWNLDRHPFSLSGGERQILNLATALSVRPDLLVIDDGLAFLSQSNKRKFTSILHTYSEESEAVIVWVTSDLRDLSYGKEAWELRTDSLTRPAYPEGPGGTVSSLKGEVPPGRATLKIDRLTFGYRQAGNSLFRNQNLTVGPFRSLAVLGDNGSGKTSLGRLLSGIVSPGKGHIGVELNGQGNPRMGFLPQFPERLFGGRTLQELLDELEDTGIFLNSSMETLEHILNEFGIPPGVVVERSIHSLDVPVIRVALTVMLCLAEYDLVILDEPLFGLGIVQRTKLLRHLRTFLSRKHMVFITHSPSDAGDLCDAAVTITEGTIERAPLPEGAEPSNA